MNTAKRALGVLALVFTVAALGAATVRAQSDQDHSAHHPDAAQAQSTQAAPAPGNGMPGMGMQGGMSGMMGGDMQQMMGMMQMMRMMDRMGQMGRFPPDGAMSVMRSDHIEGRIAFLHTELGITDAQQPQWNAFADALRRQADAMQGMQARMMQGGTPTNWPDRLSRHEQMLSARLDAIKAIEAPARALYGVLSPDQKSRADDLMSGAMGGM